jgi:hypothetical protein
MRSNRTTWTGLVLGLAVVLVVGTTTTVRQVASHKSGQGQDVEVTAEGTPVSPSSETVPIFAAEPFTPAERTMLHAGMGLAPGPQAGAPGQSPSTPAQPQPKPGPAQPAPSQAQPAPTQAQPARPQPQPKAGQAQPAPSESQPTTVRQSSPTAPNQ